MSQATSVNLQPLDKKVRNKLERTVKEARDIAEEAARAACKQLGVGLAKPDTHLNDDEKDLRRRLRIHGRQLGDKRDPQKETQQLDRLVDEIAYEHWHRMLFARFLAENHLLMYPDPDDPVSVSIDDCNDLAEDEGAKNGWELAARFATKMLPQIFRVDSPVFSLTLPPENQQQLERLLSELPDEVFTASDSLGWVYQFWQTKRKDEVNASEVKIGARELPAVTQLFTEPYMVSFLLDNSLGAWWATRRLSDEDLRNAETEQELRDRASLPGVSLDYLRFVKNEESGSWTPAAGQFDSWPESLAELKTLDPCCGSGHFLVATLLMLAPMRMELENLSAQEAVDRVLSENIHGLEIDQRCVELAAFALALAAWRFPEASGYRPLPDLNVACCGLSVSLAKVEWMKLAGDDTRLQLSLEILHEQFQNAPILGSLINPELSLSDKSLLHVPWHGVQPILMKALASQTDDAVREVGVVAFGIARAAGIMSQKHQLVMTNVPYLALRKERKLLADYTTQHYPCSKQNLGVVFIERLIKHLPRNGVCLFVSPQDWTFLDIYTDFRNYVLKHHSLSVVAKLGVKAFTTPMWDMNIMLIGISGAKPVVDTRFCGLELSTHENAEAKAKHLGDTSIFSCNQSAQLANPDQRIVFEELTAGARLGKYADALMGVSTGDGVRFHRCYWEVNVAGRDWDFIQGTVSDTIQFGGRSEAIFWQQEKGEIFELAESVKHLNHSAQNWQRGRAAWGKSGVVISQMGDLPSTSYSGEIYDCNCCAIVPFEGTDLAALWCYAEAAAFCNNVRTINQALKVPPKTLLKIPFDLAHWQEVAAEKYPNGLPQPYSDDATQWIFHGHPASSDHALQVAVARLLGYRWPAELDEEMELAEDARAWVERRSELADFSDSDGIVCIPAVGTEHPAEDRLLNLLHKAYESGRSLEQQFQEKLDASDTNDSLTVALLHRDWQPSLPDSFNDWLSSLLEAADHKGKTLGSWLREKFFTQHCKLFHHRPFIWHIWDGLKDGFSVLVNYHRLDNKLLKTLIYTYLNDWINRQKQDAAAGVDGSEERLAAAEWLKERLEQILHGESPHDIFIRWKSREDQPIGWNPDLNDGVRLNIRPWMTVGDVKRKGAGLFRDKPNIHWKKDRGKDVESAPWYHLGPEYDGKEGDRINDHHLTLEEKQAARNEMEAGS